jgi:hypothetical protein
MIFSNFVRTESGNQIFFKNITPIDNVGSIKFYKDNASGSFAKKEFRWSFNGNYWASWEILNQGNLTNTAVSGNPCLYIEVRYVKAAESAKVTTFSINYEESKVVAQTTTESSSTQQGTVSCKDIKDSDGTCGVGKENLSSCDLLDGKPGSYYLWRPNHKGTQPISSVDGLQQILNNLTYGVQNSITTGDNVSGAGIGVFYEKSGQTLVFKRINAGAGASISELNGVITLSVDASVISKDPSINELYDFYYSLESNLYDLSIYIDNKFIQVDASINDLYNKIDQLDGSIITGFSNVGGGPGLIFKQINGSVTELRTIAAGNSNVTVTTVGDQVRISLDASASGQSVWSDLDPISADVGGLNPGDDVSIGANSIEILERILYEYFPPNINLNLNPSAGYFQKWVDAPEVSIYGNFNNYDFTKVKIYDASLLINGIGDPAFPKIPYSDVSFGNFLWNDTAPPYGLNWDDVIYTVKIYNKVGTTIMPAADASAAIQFVNPYIWGIVNNTITAANITPSILYGFISDGNKLIVPKQSNEINFIRDGSIGMKIKFVYAYDASYGDLNTIFDVKNDFNVTTSFESTTLNLTLGATPSPIPYKVYIKSHWIDVSTFKLIFNI